MNRLLADNLYVMLRLIYIEEENQSRLKFAADAIFKLYC